VKRRVVLVVEDALSEAVMRRIITDAGDHLAVDRPIVTQGSGTMRRDMPKYRAASRAVPHIVVADLDQVRCAVDLRRQWQAMTIPDTMLFNVAVRETEAWLLADQEGVAVLLGIATNRVPRHADEERDPKRALVNLARRCRNRRLRDELVPAEGSVNQVGPVYTARMSSFVAGSWSVRRARTASPSLARAIDRIGAFAHR
jgi:hypothetical protein